MYICLDVSAGACVYGWGGVEVGMPACFLVCVCGLMCMSVHAYVGSCVCLSMCMWAHVYVCPCVCGLMCMSVHM